MLNFFKRNWLLLAVTGVFLALGGFYMFRNLQPFTQNAFVVANTRPVSALVEGYLTDVHVVNNQFVKKGDPLFTVFQEPYRLRVEQLTHAIAAKRAERESQEAQLKVLACQIDARVAVLSNDTYLAERATEMYAVNATSQAYAEERRQMRIKSEAELGASRNQESVIRAQLKMMDAQIKQMESELKLAEVNLHNTVVRALADGYVVNMFVCAGGYYEPGDILCAFVEAGSFRVQANFEETALGLVRKGQTAEVCFWQYPGRTFHGVVEDTHWGAERRRFDPATGVPVVEKENQWFLLPQRFPVEIRITDLDPDYPLHLAGSAYVRLEGSSGFFRQLPWRVFQW